MTLEHFKSWILALLATYTFLSVGRLVMWVSDCQRPVQNAPLNTFIAGVGLWYVLYTLVFAPYDVSLTMSWWGLFALAVAGTVLIFRLGRKQNYEYHFTAQLLMSLALFLPSFYNIATDVPVLQIEYQNILQSLESVFTVARMSPENGAISSQMFQLSPSFMGGQWVVATVVMMNVLLLSFVAMTLLRLSGVGVRWSNLALAGGAGVLGVTLLNPFFSLDVLLSTQSEIFVAALVLVSCTPLLEKERLPFGFSIMPQALSLALLMGAGAEYFTLVLAIVAFYIVRYLCVEYRFKMADFFSLLLLVSLPLLCFYAWAMVIHQVWPWQGEALAAYVPDMKEASWVGGLVIACVLSILYFKAWHAPLRDFAWLTIPLALPVLMVLLGVSWSWSVLQFILILPIWKLYLLWYENSEIKKVSYASPWGVGMVLVLAFWGLQGFYQSSIEQKHTPPMEHVLKVAERIDSAIVAEQKLAVLDVEETRYYSDMMDYALSEHIAEDVTYQYLALDGDLAPFHYWLYQKGYDYLWIHSATDVMRENINRGLRSDHSYLFKIEEGKLKLVKGGVFPHLGYTQP